ncbi:hypothetical protein BU17DRAFT_81418 [Hysterangium stoloniferum]|nr:hypothetical protein BU17DRAFT_81418 [Hysterangium stoloniferum]
MPKGYKMIALHTFFLCAQNHLPFLEYAATLADAHNALGPNDITAAIYKYQLLFHAHPMLILRIMAIPDLDLEDISFGNLVALMSMQWESFVIEIPATCSTPRTSLSYTSTAASVPPILPMPRANEPWNRNPLSLTDCEHLSAVGGCWRCRKVPTDAGWTPHIGRTCPGDPTQGVSPGPNFVPPTPPVIKREHAGGCWRCQKVPTDARWTPHIGCTCPGDPTQGVSPGPDFVPPTPPVIKREHAGAILLDADEYFAQGEDQPEDSDVWDEDTDSDATDWPGHPCQCGHELVFFYMLAHPLIAVSNFHHHRMFFWTGFMDSTA